MSVRTPLHCCLAIVAMACSDSPAGPPALEPLPPPPPLEALPFAQVGSGTFVFMRNAVGPQGYSAAYVIDGSGHRSFPGLASSDRLILAPSVAPDGRRIAFLGYTGELSAAYDVYVANLDGTGEQRAASFESNSEGPPSWTPNGGQIAFVVDAAGASLYQQSPVSSPTDRVLLRKLTPGADGSLVCPYMFRENGPISISVEGAIALNCMGREIDVVRADGSVTAYTASAPGAGRISVLHAPAWSPDGTRLALIEEIRETSGFETVGTSVIVVEPAGGATTVLATVPTTATGAARGTLFPAFSLCWLPGGSGIMFTAADGPAATHIFIVTVQSGVVTRVTSAPNVVDHSVSCSR